MKLRNRVLLRAGVAAAAAVAASVAFTAPAFADDTADLGVKLEGTTIAANAEGKFPTVSLSNAGPSDAQGVVVTFDVSEVLNDLIQFGEEDLCGGPENGKIVCSLADPIPAGAEYDLELPMTKKTDATGSAGSVTVTIEHAGTDKNEANNSATAEIVLSEESGADLRVWAHDVYGYNADEDAFTGEPVVPGTESFVLVQILNYGDKTAKGVKVTVSLPQHVTFTEPEPECEFSADKRTATCAYAALELVPWGMHSGDGVPNFFWAVKVDESAPAPATLHGTVTAAAIDEAEVEVPAAAARNAGPKAEVALPENFKDIDATDNTDEFGVFVAAAGGEGGGGGLPVTGPAAGIIGGVGGAVVIAGAVLFFLARRRRIVTVTPDA
ncbi:LPXTG cell wall anchor domain-containing protein [Asanoa sp. NPDC050611]|uniref:LPXTG cell wall anchor domain-containing protein n=1 Tax=Asanoa sp. NPDC050611 TaxID=3157098 RepID=UPI0033DCF244